MNLPAEIDPEEFHTKYRPDFDEWRSAVEEVCSSVGVPCTNMAPFREGSNLVARVEDRWVVKIFPPFHRDQWESERCVLKVIHEASTLPTPEMIGEGERTDGYTYVVMTLLDGVCLEGHWKDLSLTERAGLMGDLGELMRAIHLSPIGTLSQLEPDFGEMLDVRLANLTAHHKRVETPDWIIERIESFVPDALKALDLATPPVLLTGEYTPLNLLVKKESPGTRLAGMLDFGDCMAGPAVYDILGPIVFLGEGNPNLLEPFFEARALLDYPPSPEVRQGLLALLLAHRYSHPPSQFRIAGWREAGSMEALADLLLGS